MPCNYPATGRKSPNGTITYYGWIQRAEGRLPPLPPNYKDFPLPCGKCTGCKLEYGRQWAVRLMHEAQQHEKTCFITPTYNDENLPTPASRAASQSLVRARLAGRPELPRQIHSHTHAKTHAHENQEAPASLSKSDLQAFTKRLNEDVRRRSGKGIKYYACGEYGDEKHRPHYHIAVFGEDFSDDRTYWKKSPSGAPLWRSSRLARLWPHGDTDIGQLTFESAAYIARYIVKKITGKKAETHYDGRIPEFAVMSRRPGLGKTWFEQYNDDIYPHDHVIARGHPAKPPRYYDKLLEALKPYEHALLKEQREAKAQKAERLTPQQLEAREAIMLAKLQQTKRQLE